MDAIATFLSMGGYWPYVWPAFAVAAVVLGGLWLASWRSMRAREAELAATLPRRKGEAA